MKKILHVVAIVLSLASCTKDNSAPDRILPGRTLTDSLLIYQSDNGAVNARGIFSKSLITGDSLLLVVNATMPYVANQRIVYIKSGKTIGYARFNGVSRFLADLNAPVDPCLSIDARLICVVDKNADQYQLIVMDTLGNRTTLYQSVLEMKEPEFSTDGVSIFFSQKNSKGNFGIYKIASGGGEPVIIANPDVDADFTDCAATANKLFFLQNRVVSEKISTEICSVSFTGSDFQTNTDYSKNWSQAGIKIDNLRKVNNSMLVFVSDFGNDNKDIYIIKVDNFLSTTRMTDTSPSESYPNLIPAYVKDY